MHRHLLRRSRRQWLSLRLWKRRLLFWSGAVSVGAAAVLFAVAGEEVNTLFHRVTGISMFLPLLISPLGLALVAWLTRRYFPGAQGSGIPQTIAALQLEDGTARRGLLSLRIAVSKVFLTLLGLLSGASVGREGPTVQIGASIMHALGSYTRFPRHEMERGLILAGGAAGVAAAFNTPLAGIVFAIEEMSRSFEQRTSGTVLTAVIVAGIASIGFLGNYTYFGHTDASLDMAHGSMAVLACGVLGGLLGGLFSRILVAASDGLPGRLGGLRRERPIHFAAVCGLALAVIGLLSAGTTYGTGYHEVRHILEGTETLPAAYGVLKLAATVVSYLSGIPGGIFAPSLAVGAGLGVNIAELLTGTPAGAVAIVGMVAYFSGVVQAPITAFVIVMEMTDNHDMVVPLMAAALIASGVSRLICRKPLYKALAENLLAASAMPGVQDSAKVRPQTTRV